MKKMIFHTIVSAAIAAAVLFCVFLFGQRGRNHTVCMTVITEIREISELYLLKVLHGDMIRIDSENNDGEKSSLRAIYNGEAFIGIDCSMISAENINSKERTLTLILPPLKVMEAKLVEKDLRVIDSEGPDKLYLESIKALKAQEDLERSVCRNEYFHAAEKQAETLLSALFAEAGWQTDFIWRKNGD